MGFIVAIDGPAGSGKGTIAKLIGKKFGLINIDTGAMYRCVALECLNNNIEYTNLDGIEKILKNIEIEFKNTEKGKAVILNKKDVTEEIRETKVNNVVSQFSTVKIIRDKMTALQQEMGKDQNIIMEGRDIGTVVFPNADVKIYLDCSCEERANRRYKQNLEKGIKCTYQEVLKNIKERTKLDFEREIAPLVKADDAIVVDSTNINIEETVEKISNIIEPKLNKKNINEAEKKNKKNKMKSEGIWKKIARAIVKFAMYTYCKIVYKMQIIGIDNVPKQGPVIFCGNHRSYLDPPLIEITCKRDDTRFIAKKELTKNKFLAFLGIIFNAILVNRDSKDIGALKQSLITLKQGGCVALFPEGTRNGLAKGEKTKDGAAYFALNSDAVVIPVGIKGGSKAFDKVTVTYGKPLDFSEEKKNRKDKDTMDKVTKEIMDNIIELSK